MSPIHGMTRNGQEAQSPSGGEASSPSASQLGPNDAAAALGSLAGILNEDFGVRAPQRRTACKHTYVCRYQRAETALDAAVVAVQGQAAELAALRAELAERKRVGAQMANACFNLASPQRSFSEVDRGSLRRLYELWDAIPSKVLP